MFLPLGNIKEADSSEGHIYANVVNIHTEANGLSEGVLGHNNFILIDKGT